jgi:hypothetical protein
MFSEMESPSIVVKSQTAQQVVLETTWIWQVSSDLAFQGAAVQTTAPAYPPCPTLLSTRPSTANGAVDSDEDGNVYWNTSGVELGAGGTKSWSWTNRIWPGE